ncbi:MAG: DUF3494 domain-containing protein [Chitinophagales bacterium]|nr:DUF3494 domain-containing protein [Chitinophagales bacterium]
MPNLGSLVNFGVLSGGTITATDTIQAHGYVGGVSLVDTKIHATNIYQGGALVSTALADLNTAKSNMLAMGGNNINGLLNGQVITEGTYSVTGNANLNDTLFLVGNQSSVIVFNISGNLTVGVNARVVWQSGSMVNPEQIYWNVQGTTAINSSCWFNGVVLGTQNITVNGIFYGNVTLFSLQNVTFDGQQFLYHNSPYVMGFGVTSVYNMLGSRSAPCEDNSPLICGEIVKSGGFEVYDVNVGCPKDIVLSGQYFPGCSWETTPFPQAVPTPDLFNTCSVGTDVAVPLNGYGTQQPQSGSGYAGIFSGDNAPGSFYTEGLTQPLANLVVGRVYYTEVFVCLAEASTLASRMGFMLTDGSAQSYFTYLHPTPITSKAAWIPMRACFTATPDHKEIWITRNINGNTPPVPVASGPGPYTYSNFFNFNFAYYYVDGVSVKPLADAGLGKTVCSLNTTLGNGCDPLTGVTYSWSKSSGPGTVGFAPSNAMNTTATFSTAGTYVLTLTASFGGCTATHDVTVTVSLPPNAAISPSNATICSGQQVTLTAIGGTTYSWNNGLGSGATKTVSPLSTTNYTVTVTNAANCSATATASVTVNNAPFTITKTVSNATPITQSNFTYTITLTNITSSSIVVSLTDNVPASLQIISAPGLNITGQQLANANITIAPNASVNFVVTVKSTLTFGGSTQCNYSSQSVINTATASLVGGSCSFSLYSSATVTVLSHRVVGSAVNIPTVSQAIAQGMLLPMGGPTNSTNTSQTFTIDGNFIVDMNYDFGNSAQFINSYANCRPGAQVTVNSNCKLSGYNLRFQPCTQLWKGIVVTGSSWFTSAGELLLRNSTVNGAQYGVTLYDGSKIAVSNTEFRECFVGVYFPDVYLLTPSVVFTSPFAGNIFNSFGNMPAAYSGMVNATNQPTVAQIPTTNRRTWAGIHVGRLSNFTCSGNTSATTFSGLANGIVANECALNVTGSFFNDILPYGYNFNGLQGNGIHSKAALVQQIGGNPYASVSLYQRGNGFNTNPFTCYSSFGNCTNGIVAVGVNVDIAQNCFSYTNAISVTGVKRGNIRINNNNFHTTNKAILLSNNDPVNIMDVGPSTVVQNGGVSAIDIQEQNNAPLTSAEIHHNRIQMNTNLFTGLALNSCSGVNSTNYNYKVYNNTVILNTPTSNLMGVSYQNCQFVESSQNLVAGTSASTQSFVAGYPTAINYSTSSMRLKCDSVANVYNGKKIYGTCNNTTIRGCVMNNHTYGFYQTNGGTIPPQGSSTESYGNRWRGSYITNSAKNENAALTLIYVKGTSLPYWPHASGITTPNTGWFTSSVGNPFLCTGIFGAGFKNEEDDAILNSLDEQILDDSLRFEEFNEQLKWQNEMALYEKLKDNPEVLEQKATAEVFLSKNR